MNARIIHHDNLPHGGFAGIVERKMVMTPLKWPDAAGRTDISHGFGDFIYLSLGQFLPNDGAPLHPHENVDIVSFVFSGSVGHKGTLGSGTEIHAPEVQVQRAGTGIKHAEFNLTDQPADIAQIWFNPPEADLEPAYKNFKISSDGMTTVLGDRDESFNSNMVCEIGYLAPGNRINLDQQFVTLVTRGKAQINGRPVFEGDLVEGEGLSLSARSNLGLVLIYKNS